MKLLFTFLILFIISTKSIFSQSTSFLTIQKINGHYTKTLKFPVDTRIIKYNDQVVVLRLDSIKNGYWYGNRGQDSIEINDIKIVNLRGPKEFIKYTALTACAAATFGAIYFTVYAFNHPVVLDSNNDIYKYIGMGYMATFSSLGTIIYLYPRTRFKTTKYKFQTN